MNKLKNLNIHTKVVLLLIAILLIPALFGKIGVMPYRTDEPTRLNVAIEMFISGNYVTPRINGEFYYNKPPLYNWILIGFNKISGGFFDEFSMRVPTVLFLLLFAFFIWKFTEKKIGNLAALSAALCFVTGGRILFWDSYQALIDIPFSLVIFLNFFVLMKIPESKRQVLLFALSYFLIGLAFLFKGFPAIVFQALSLPAILIFYKKWKMLFSWKHFLGSAAFIAIVGSYFMAYAHYNDVKTLTSTLFDQSASRTAVSDNISIKDTILHFFTFPFEMVFHFLPWSLILLVFVSKRAWGKVKSDPFLSAIFLLFIINIPIYWISVDVKPRYLFMFSPLLLIVGFGVMQSLEENKDRIYKILTLGFKYLGIIAGIIAIAIPSIFISTISTTTVLSGITAALICSIFIWAMHKQPRLIILSVVGILFVYRILFNFFEMPSRYSKSNDVIFKTHAIVAARLTQDKPVYIWTDCTVNHEFTFYFTQEKRQILKRWNKEPQVGAYYILDNYKWNYTKTFKDQKYLLIKKSPSRMGDVFLVQRVK